MKPSDALAAVRDLIDLGDTSFNTVQDIRERLNEAIDQVTDIEIILENLRLPEDEHVDGSDAIDEINLALERYDELIETPLPIKEALPIAIAILRGESADSMQTRERALKALEAHLHHIDE